MASHGMRAGPPSSRNRRQGCSVTTTGRRRHAIKLIPTAYNFKGQAGVTWYVLPAYLPQAEAPAEPAPAPKPAPEPPAANTRPRIGDGQQPSPAPQASPA